MRERDVAGREGAFIAEGEVVVRTLLSPASLHDVHSLLLAEKRVAALRDAVDVLPEDTPVYVAPRAVMDAIVGFPIHRGVLALGRRAPAWDTAALLTATTTRSPRRRPGPSSLLSGAGPQTAAGNLGPGLRRDEREEEAGLVVGLVGVSNHDNVGGVFRNAAAFGADAVLLDLACCDPLYRKAIRVSTGSALRLPFARVASADAMAELLTAHGYDVLALSPAGRETLAEVRPPERAAVLLGAEGAGLPSALLARLRSVRIPMAGGVDSLNVAVTSGIVLHHLAAARS